MEQKHRAHQARQLLSTVLQHPDKLLGKSADNIYKQSIEAVAKLFECAKDASPDVSVPIKSLLLKGFDLDQIWEQLQLLNEPVIEQLQHEVEDAEAAADVACHGDDGGRSESADDSQNDSDLSSDQDDEHMMPSDNAALSADQNADEAEAGSEALEAEVEDDKDDLDDQDDLGVSEVMSNKRLKKIKPSVVDDEFFKLAEMAAFLDEQDALEERRLKERRGLADTDDDKEAEDEPVDYFADIPSEDEEEEDATGAAELHYHEYFDPPAFSYKGSKFNGSKGQTSTHSHTAEQEEVMDEEEDNEQIEDDEERSDEEDEAELSKFEREQRRLAQQIEQLEEFNVSAKPWQLTGEVQSKKRPANSLLEEVLDFDVVVPPAPEVTEETTMQLEDVIKKRILDNLFDDVERKTEGPQQPFKPRPLAEIEQEQSSKSLAEVYEKEYMTATGQASSEVEESLKKQHDEIRQLMSQLEAQLNALTNFHYTPKPPTESVEIVTNAPAIKMEDVTPASLSDAKRLAPEEVYEKPKGEVMADTEKDATDKKRDRRKKKLAKHHNRLEQERKDKEKEKKVGIAGLSKGKAKSKLEAGNKQGLKTTIVESDKPAERMTSSTKFFKALQQQTKADVDAIVKAAKAPKRQKNKGSQAAQLKL